MNFRSCNYMFSLFSLFIFLIHNSYFVVCLEKNDIEDQTCSDGFSGNDQCESVVSQSPVTTYSTEENEIHVIITFTNVQGNLNLQEKFGTTVRSLFQYSSCPVALFIIGDAISQKIAKEILQKHVLDHTKYRLAELDVDELAKNVHTIIRPMQERFSYKPGAYYSHALFFLSMVLHRVLPETISRVIMLDADLKFTDDIAKLHHRFELFENDNVMGIANEAQPVYQHAFHMYRNAHPGTVVGSPPPSGLPGFNSGVLLLDLNRMRHSTLYNSLLNEESVQVLCDQFHFKGHLGDQDFFTLVGMRHPQLFHVLPCQWNRQLCQWWREHGYQEIFDEYFKCDGEIKIYHGNCNTPIP